MSFDLPEQLVSQLPQRLQVQNFLHTVSDQALWVDHPDLWDRVTGHLHGFKEVPVGGIDHEGWPGQSGRIAGPNHFGHDLGFGAVSLESVPTQSQKVDLVAQLLVEIDQQREFFDTALTPGRPVVYQPEAAAPQGR